MNRRDIFKALTVAPAALLPKAEKPKSNDFTITLPQATPPGQSITIVAMGDDKWAVLR